MKGSGLLYQPVPVTNSPIRATRRSGATYMCDRNGDIARSNAVLRKLLHQGGEADETHLRN